MKQVLFCLFMDTLSLIIGDKNATSCMGRRFIESCLRQKNPQGVLDIYISLLVRRHKNNIEIANILCRRLGVPKETVVNRIRFIRNRK